MPVNKNAYERYRIIDKTIRSNRFVASRQRILEQLNDELLTITADQLSKDIAYMQTHKQAPIIFNRKIGGYIYTDTNYSFEHNAITDDDKWVLDFANATMNAYGNSNLVIHFDGLVNKLITGSSKQKSNLAQGSDFIAVEKNTNTEGYQYLYTLYQSIIEQKVVMIQYHPFGRDIKEHTLSPYLLKQYRNRWYVIGYAHKKKLTLVFALDRIKELNNSKAKYFIDTNFSAEQYFKYSFGVTHNYNLLPEKVRLWFNAINKDYILSQPLHHSQEIIENTNEYAIVEINVIITWELKAMIMGYSNGIKVLSPISLQQSIATELQAAANLYK
jgi:predicted DNA-binding transcriptional regulator YafY